MTQPNHMATAHPAHTAAPAAPTKKQRRQALAQQRARVALLAPDKTEGDSDASTTISTPTESEDTKTIEVEIPVGEAPKSEPK